MNPTPRFLFRAAALLLIATGAGTLIFYRRWGIGAIPCFSWATGGALLMGFLGYRSLGTAMRCEPERFLRVVAGGVLARAFVLLVSQGAVFLVFGFEWGKRALLATTVFYIFIVIGVEVYSLQQELAQRSKGNVNSPGKTPSSEVETDK